MKTKREVLEEITKKGHCIDIMCGECPYYPTSYCVRLRKVGAMAILRMFPEKKAKNYAKEQEDCTLGVYNDTAELEYVKGFSEGYLTGAKEMLKENEQLTMQILKMRMIFNSTYGAGGNISKKKPILEVGTKIKFDNGEIATIVSLKKEIILFFESHKEKLDYLIGRTWEVVE